MDAARSFASRQPAGAWEAVSERTRWRRLQRQRARMCWTPWVGQVRWPPRARCLDTERGQRLPVQVGRMLHQAVDAFCKATHMLRLLLDRRRPGLRATLPAGTAWVAKCALPDRAKPDLWALGPPPGLNERYHVADECKHPETDEGTPHLPESARPGCEPTVEGQPELRRHHGGLCWKPA